MRSKVVRVRGHVSIGQDRLTCECGWVPPIEDNGRQLTRSMRESRMREHKVESNRKENA